MKYFFGFLALFSSLLVQSPAALASGTTSEACMAAFLLQRQMHTEIGESALRTQAAMDGLKAFLNSRLRGTEASANDQAHFSSMLNVSGEGEIFDARTAAQVRGILHDFHHPEKDPQNPTLLVASAFEGKEAIKEYLERHLALQVAMSRNRSLIGYSPLGLAKMGFGLANFYWDIRLLSVSYDLPHWFMATLMGLYLFQPDTLVHDFVLHLKNRTEPFFSLVEAKLEGTRENRDWIAMSQTTVLPAQTIHDMKVQGSAYPDQNGSRLWQQFHDDSWMVSKFVDLAFLGFLDNMLGGRLSNGISSRWVGADHFYSMNPSTGLPTLTSVVRIQSQRPPKMKKKGAKEEVRDVVGETAPETPGN